MNFHSILLGIGLITLVGTLISLRREHIRTEYSISWLTTGAILTGLALFPKFLDRAAASFGLEPQVCFLIIGGVLVSSLIFEISHVVSRLRDENVILAQRVAILEYQTQQIDAKSDTQRS